MEAVPCSEQIMDSKARHPSFETWLHPTLAWSHHFIHLKNNNKKNSPFPELFRELSEIIYLNSSKTVPTTQ